jgi:hypothetical protein
MFKYERLPATEGLSSLLISSHREARKLAHKLEGFLRPKHRCYDTFFKKAA